MLGPFSPSSLGFRAWVEAARPEAAKDNSPTWTGVRRRGGYTPGTKIANKPATPFYA
ncbi:MAG: hypothetical protein QW074_09180 [Candidatus Caldarchaeum sp.]